MIKSCVVLLNFETLLNRYYVKIIKCFPNQFKQKMLVSITFSIIIYTVLVLVLFKCSPKVCNVINSKCAAAIVAAVCAEAAAAALVVVVVVVGGA